MPVLESSYKSPISLLGGHLETILPAVIRKPSFIFDARKALELSDGDFVELEIVNNGNRKCVILSHGLEGDSQTSYMKSTAKYFSNKGYDVIAWNFRGCGLEKNKLPRMYHSGATEDLHEVVEYASKQYEELYLIGFSMGGNQTLKYLGERTIDSKVKASAAFSVPCDLQASGARLEEWDNIIYLKRFLKKLGRKIKYKSKLYPKQVSYSGYERISTFKEFDDRYTAPLHGFENSLDYYKKSSSAQFLGSIKVPTLLVNAKNDPFLVESCFPFKAAHFNCDLYLEAPEHGGHVGFVSFGSFWMAKRAHEFFVNKA